MNDALGQPINVGDTALWSGKFVSNGLIKGVVEKINAKMIRCKAGHLTYTLYPKQLVIINKLVENAP